MKEDFKKTAVSYFLEGYSCSEAIAKTAVEYNLASEEIISIATSFSGGMSSRCACGALTGAQIVIGFLFGKLKDNSARAKSKEMYDKFIEKNKASCCRILTSKFTDFHSQERKHHCVKMVEDSSEILCDILEKAQTKI